jgi:hypothetical protein
MYIAVITIWVATGSGLEPHTLYAGKMPIEVCQAVAEKLSIPLMFNPDYTISATCVPYNKR